MSGKSALWVIETTTKVVPRRLKIGCIRLDISQHFSCCALHRVQQIMQFEAIRI